MSNAGLRFETALNAALLEAEARDLAALPTKADLARAYPLSDFLDGRLKRAMQRKKNRQNLRRAGRYAKRLAACLVLVLAATACTFAPVKAVQDAVLATLVEWQDQFARFTFSGGLEGGASLPEGIGIGVDDLPDGYALIYEYSDSMTFSAVFGRTESEYVQVDIRQVSDSHHTYYDNEYTSAYLLEIMDTEVQWMAHQEGQNVLLWNSNGFVYVITSTEPLNTCIEIAKKFM